MAEDKIIPVIEAARNIAACEIPNESEWNTLVPTVDLIALRDALEEHDKYYDAIRSSNRTGETVQQESTDPKDQG